MEAIEQIRKFEEFIEDRYRTKLLSQISRGLSHLVVDFKEIAEFDTELAEELINEPEESIKAAELAISNLEGQSIRIRLSNLPASYNVMLRNIRTIHIGKLICIDGLVRQKSDVRPVAISAKFECPSCGQIIPVLQLETTFKEPSRCSCGRKGHFRLLSKELLDAQRIVLEETPESLEGGEQPKRMSVFLKEDLVSPLTEKKTNPGSKVMVIGYVKEIPMITKGGTKSTTSDLVIEGNNIASVQEDFYDVNVTEQEEKQILELSRDPKVFERLTQSIAPSIYGYDEIKGALLLQLFGGLLKKRGDGLVTRGDMHILLLGDPGSGKSQLLKRMSIVAPKGRYVSGKGVTGAGLTAAVVRDEFLGGWSLEAGALVLANNGICCIDEMDKMSNEDRAAMHEALEQQTISISKANIHATLISRTTVLAAANPKFGRFDPYGLISEQIDLPPTLINRFDLIFPIKDLPSAERDEKMAAHILSLHGNPQEIETDIDTNLLKKYVSYARQKSNPHLSDDAIEEIKEFYVKMRMSGTADEAGIRSIPISARQLEALVRLSEASAKVRLQTEVTRVDAKNAIKLLQYCLMQVGFDKETGKIDIDRISTGIPASQRDRIHLIKESISELESKLGKSVPIEELVALVKSKGISEADAHEIIERLKRSGDVYEPRKGFLQRI